MEKRDWELWDQPSVAQWIDNYWNSEAEVNHRKKLLGTVSKFLKEGDRFLEVGCGSGHIYRYLTELVKVDYTGVDCSEEMLKIGRAAFPGVDFRKGDGYKLEFPDGSFKAVAAIDVLQHVPDVLGIIRELIRVSSDLVFFTLTEAPVTTFGKEVILGNTFLWNNYSFEEAKTKVGSVAGGIPFKTLPIRPGARLWVLSKKADGI